MKATSPRSDFAFAAWFAKVDAAVVALCGMSVNDLPDCCFRDWFEDGVSPSSAARRAVKAAA